MFYLIYKITNTVNNKFYVGKHKTKNKDDGYMGSGTILKRAIEKYGIEKFTKEIIYEFSLEEEMNNMEREIVDEDFVNREDTYNIMIGGNGGFDFINKHNLNNVANNHITAKEKRLELLKDDEEFKRFFCEAVRKGMTEEAKEQISKSLKETWEKIGSPWAGRNHSDETKRKISQSNKLNHVGDKNSQYGTMWIYNEELKENKKIKKDEPIPVGWKRGRRIKT